MNTLIAIGGFLGIFLALSGISVCYEQLRIKLNKPKIGFEIFLRQMLKRDDYLSINGRIYRFSHITRGGEPIDTCRPPLNDNTYYFTGDIACFAKHHFGYIIIPINNLRNCNFIYGKYGLKWASCKEEALTAKNKIEAYYS